MKNFVTILMLLLMVPLNAQALTFMGSLESTKVERSIEHIDMGSLDDPISLGSLQDVSIPLTFDEIIPEVAVVPQTKVWFYSSESCGYCPGAKKELEEVPDIELIELGEDDHPSWVSQYPTVHFQTPQGKWTQVRGWTPKHRAYILSLLDIEEPNDIEELVVEEETDEVLDYSYPTRRGWWTVNGSSRPSREYLVKHLLSGGAHKGKFSANYLANLNYDELHALHSDDHEGRVKWAYVDKPKAVIEKRVATPTTQRRVYRTYCPSCPKSKG